MIRLVILSVCVFFNLNAFAKDVRVTLFNFENDNGSFWGPINESFRAKFSKDRADSSRIVYTELKYAKQNEGQLLNEVKSTKPDILVMSDDFFYRKLAKAIKQDQSLSKVPVVFASMNMKAEELNKAESRIRAVFIEYPADEIVATLRGRFAGIKRMAILRGPFGEHISRDILSKDIDDLEKIDDYSESVWANWLDRLTKIEKNYDAAWILMPYGVLDGKSQVSFDKVAAELKRFSKPTIGLGQVSASIERTLTAAIDPREVGEKLAELLSSTDTQVTTYKPSNFIWSTTEQQNLN